MLASKDPYQLGYTHLYLNLNYPREEPHIQRITKRKHGNKKGSDSSFLFDRVGGDLFKILIIVNFY